MPNQRRSVLDLSISARAGRGHAAFLRRQIPAAARLIKTPLREFSVALVDDREMKRVHAEFLDDPTTTDVVTFALEEDATGKVTSGEVVICVPQAMRCAHERGHSTRNELLLYAIHGMLHLSGYDDTSKREFDRMHAREDEILSGLGLGRVFAAAAPRAPRGAKSAPSPKASKRSARRRSAQAGGR